MRIEPRTLFGLPRPIARVVTLGIGLAVFGMVAGAFGPFASEAEVAMSKEARGAVAWGQVGGTDQAAVAIAGVPGLSLGQFVGAEYRVIVTATPEGPRYTVCTHGGKVLQDGLAAAELHRAFPGLDLDKAVVDPSAEPALSPLMIADDGN